MYIFTYNQMNITFRRFNVAKMDGLENININVQFWNECNYFDLWSFIRMLIFINIFI